MAGTLKTGAGTNLAWKLMESMGWEDGQGLGKAGQGQKVALKPRKKDDNAGLGSQRTSSKWIDASCAYDAVISKLTIAYGGAGVKVSDTDSSDDEPQRKGKEGKEGKKRKRGSSEEDQARDSKKERKEKKRKAASSEEEQEEEGEKRTKKDKRRREKASEEEEEEEMSERKKAKKAKKDKKRRDKESEEEEAEAEPTTMSRPESTSRHLFAKRLRSKQVSNYSADHMAEIFATTQRANHVIKTQLNQAAAYTPLALRQHKSLGEMCDVVSETECEAPETEEAEEVFEKKNRKIRYEGGFTEDTQVSIYNQAVDSQIKGRTGLGLGKKLSKSQRREQAQSEARMMTAGSYLRRKFVYAGTIEEVHQKKVC